MGGERKTRRGRPVLVVVLLLVNAAAVWGQAGWGLEHIVPVTWTDWRAGLALALAFALAIELTGVFLSISADDAEDQGLPSGGIRLASYGVGLLSGALNFSHWDGAAAITFGLLSAISPFLWGINSRVNRSRPIAPSRRFWHPVRSVGLIRHMAWEGIALESDGIASLAGATPASEPIAATVDVDVDEVVDRWTQPMIDTYQQEIEPPSAALLLPAPERKVRASNVDTEKAVRLLLDGREVEEAAGAAGVSLSTVRLYAKVVRLLRSDPQMDIGPKVDGKSVRPELVAIIRDQMNRERAL